MEYCHIPVQYFTLSLQEIHWSETRLRRFVIACVCACLCVRVSVNGRALVCLCLAIRMKKNCLFACESECERLSRCHRVCGRRYGAATKCLNPGFHAPFVLCASVLTLNVSILLM